MPRYVYQVIQPDGRGETFEVFQSMHDPPLERHPETGAPVKRVPVAPNISTRYSDASTRRALSDRNLEKLGFTKYVRGEKGYEKTAGSGPDLLKRSD